MVTGRRERARKEGREGGRESLSSHYCMFKREGNDYSERS